MLSTSCPSMVREATSRANDTVGANTYCPPLQLGDSGRVWHHDKMLLKSNENHRVIMGNWELPSKMVVICLTNYHGRPIIMKRLITKTTVTISTANIQPAKVLVWKKQNEDLTNTWYAHFTGKYGSWWMIFLVSVQGKWGGLGQHKLTMRPNKCIQMWT
jgi:hypothetical protein